MDTTHFKNKLEEELAILEKELKSVGRRNPQNPADWEAKPDSTERSADPTDSADTIEDFEENTAILKQLEIRFNEIKEALSRITDGTYGICEKGKEIIETDRLEANPAARTCKAHMQG
ncbi:MAG: hypothetical protein AAB587_00290 [Patescibacteria group bacterium]